MNLATRVQHVRSRAALLDVLLPRLHGLNPQVVTDPGGPRPSSWRTHRLCLESVPDDATHVLCIQDDALPCDEFAALAQSAILERPDRIVCMFVPGLGHLTRRFMLERKRGSRWLEFPQTSFVPLVAVCYPADIARQIPPFADRRRMHAGRADDAVVATFCRAHRITVCATVPCLVEHNDGVASAMGMRSGNGASHRLAAWFVQSPLQTGEHAVI